MGFIEIFLFIEAVIASIVSYFWRDIVGWIKNSVIPKLQATWGQFLKGVKQFFKKIGDRFNQVSKAYSYKDDEWIETTTVRKVSESEVPPEIPAKVKRGQEDFTNELELEMTS